MARKLNPKVVQRAVDWDTRKIEWEAVHGEVYGAVDGAVDGAVEEAVRVAVNLAVRWAVYWAVYGVVHRAVFGAVRVGPLHPNLRLFMAEIQQTRGVET